MPFGGLEADSFSSTVMRSVFFALLLFPLAASSQTRPVSLVVKAAGEPQAGLDVRLADKLSVRGLAALATDFEDTSVVATFAALYRVGGPGRLATRVGVSTTVADFEDAALFGVLFGVEYALSDRFGVFGEVALDADFGDGIGVVRTVNNTGVGVRYGL